MELLKAYEKISETASLHIAAGIHPQYIGDNPDRQIAELSEILNDNKSISAIGEIGLDYRKDMPDRELQKEVFRKQLEMSLDYSLPVSIHSVSACEDTLKILHAYPDAKGIMHGYAYSAEAAREFIKLGFRLGVGTTLLKPGAKKLPETVKAVPQEYLITETDLPFSYKPTSIVQAQSVKPDSLPQKKDTPVPEDRNALECEYFTPDNLTETAELHAKFLSKLVNTIQLINPH